MPAPTVFISYSHDSEEHRARVLGLSERLRRDGIETILDQYINGSPQQGWPRWMLDQLDAAEFVLVVCTETYYRRFRGHEQPGKGKGVDWEHLALRVHKFAVGGIVALVHDVIIAVGWFTLLGRTFSLTVLAAGLTIVDYSINDTIVIYDRIRELLKREGKRPFREIIDLAVNQTLSRSILTSLTVFFVLAVLFAFGGEIISDFSLILLIGVVIGSYSTIFIAAPVILFWEGKGIRLRK